MAVDTSAAAESAAQAAAETTAIIESVEAVAETVIENAEARVEAAQEVAQQIADAAMQTAIGQRVDETNRRLDEWHGKQLALEVEIASLKSSQETILATLAEMSVKLSSQESPSLLIPQPSAETGTPAIVEEMARVAIRIFMFVVL